MSTYAAYYNIWTAQRNSSENVAQTAPASRRTSSDSTKSHSKFSLKSALNQLKPTTEPITPQGIYGPVIRNGPLFHRSEKRGNVSEKRQHSVTQAAVEGALLRG